MVQCQKRSRKSKIRVLRGAFEKLGERLLIINLEAHKDDRRITESIWKKTDEKYTKIVELWEQKTDNEIEM